MFLLDTDALSLTNTGSGFESEKVDRWRQWALVNKDQIYLSVITLMEVRFGIEKLLSKGATQRAVALRRWLLAAETTHKGRIVSITPDIAHRAGELLFKATASGMNPGSEDALIGASAELKGFVLVSRNGKDMNSLGIEWIDPLEIDPDFA